LAASGSIAAILEKFVDRPPLHRQGLPPEVTMNGALYLFSWDAVRRTGKIYSNPARSYGLLMDRLHSIEIENATDLAWGQFCCGARSIGYDAMVVRRRRIVALTGSRADYGHLRELMHLLARDDTVDSAEALNLPMAVAAHQRGLPRFSGRSIFPASCPSDFTICRATNPRQHRWRERADHR
jgi:hypothetical protein